MLEAHARADFVANVEMIFHISLGHRTFVHAEGWTDNLHNLILHTGSSQHCYFSPDVSLVSNIALVIIRLQIADSLSIFLSTELQRRKEVNRIV